jgi:hypothetical protein
MNCYSEEGCENLVNRVKNGNREYFCLLDKKEVQGVTECNKYVNSPPREIVINVPKVKEIPKVDFITGKEILPGETYIESKVKHRGWPKGRPRK